MQSMHDQRDPNKSPTSLRMQMEDEISTFVFLKSKTPTKIIYTSMASRELRKDLGEKKVYIQ
jgi:hypothetical protein